MTTTTVHTPAIVTDEEWDRLKTDFAESIFLPVIEKLCEADNRPQRACDLFDDKQVYSGDDRVNAILRKKNAPLFMARMNQWQKGEERTHRLLALARR